MFDPEQAFDTKYVQQCSSELKKAISPNYCVEESSYLSRLLPLAKPEEDEITSVNRISRSLITSVRADQRSVHLIDKLLQEYSLDVEEGVILMCLAEALLRIPDEQSADALIKDKLSEGDWLSHLGHSQYVFVNATSWGLLLGSHYILSDTDGVSRWENLLSKLGSNLIRSILKKAMALMGEHFVIGQSISDALKRVQSDTARGHCFSFDMLGEAALSQGDSDSYFNAYQEAIYHLGRVNQGHDILRQSISIKLSALHPRYEERQRDRVLSELYERVMDLVKSAIIANVAITVDAEEQDRLELYLDLFEKLLANDECAEWGQLGVVVQAYSKRALPVLVWLNALARERSTKIPVRLVKGAYWDSEIKLAQQKGMPGYPVFTLKEATDLSYLVCTQFLLDQDNHYLQPQFATHNVNTLACIRVLAERYQRSTLCLEFQRLHGMGDVLHELNHVQTQSLVRTYAPIGAHAQLLPYLVRRLLENGANSSFVHNLFDETYSEEQLVGHHYESLEKALDKIKGEKMSLQSLMLTTPLDLYEPDRRNSLGLNINIESQRRIFLADVSRFKSRVYQANSLISLPSNSVTNAVKVFCAYQRDQQIGELNFLDSQLIGDVIAASHCAYESWYRVSSVARAICLERMSDLLEIHRAELVHLCHVEAGKTINDAVDEVREAVDFCRYYAAEARRLFADPSSFTGPVGENNYLSYSGRGVFVCISPWNFPVAIFTGQIAAALVSGNSVIAKPAQSSSLLAHYCTKLWYQAGIPCEVLQLVLARSSEVGDLLTSDERIAGVAFTGSTEVAKRINLNLANKPGPIIPFIAETGGQNAMIVDSTALAEQVVQDVLHSAFNSTGQRCSALRVLYIQDEVADRVIQLLSGAMKELVIGDPSMLETDIGPVISEGAKQTLQGHIDHLRLHAKELYQCDLESVLENENFVAPSLFEIQSVADLDKENFGPVLHLIRFPLAGLDEVLREINESPYGLTLGIHSRNHSFIRYIEDRVHIGNIYINRNQVGAVVGVQPFGGEKMSGTGPKAGGPNYLMRFVAEHTHSENTAAMGGNPKLLGGN